MADSRLEIYNLCKDEPFKHPKKNSISSRMQTKPKTHEFISWPPNSSVSMTFQKFIYDRVILRHFKKGVKRVYIKYVSFKISFTIFCKILRVCYFVIRFYIFERWPFLSIMVWKYTAVRFKFITINHAIINYYGTIRAALPYSLRKKEESVILWDPCASLE